MIKLDKISEISDGKTEISKGYLDIKPVEEITDQEASDFISNELKKAHDESEIDTYDRLLSEVFNRSEEDVDVEFNIGDRLSKVIEKFKVSNWEDLDINAKLPVIKELIDAIGDELGLNKIPELVIAEDKDDAYGAYDARNNSVTLNGNYLNNASELVNTIAHELRHAFQHMRAELLETWEDAIYKANFDNYIYPVALPAGGWLFFTDYMDQYVEVEARVFANLLTEAMK